MPGFDSEILPSHPGKGCRAVHRNRYENAGCSCLLTAPQPIAGSSAIRTQSRMMISIGGLDPSGPSPISQDASRSRTADFRPDLCRNQERTREPSASESAPRRLLARPADRPSCPYAVPCDTASFPHRPTGRDNAPMFCRLTLWSDRDGICRLTNHRQLLTAGHSKSQPQGWTQGEVSGCSS